LRAGISIRHTEGFHPHPYTSIPLPLPLGFSSECEILEFGLLDGATLETLPGLLNETLPSGLTVHRCYEGGKPFRRLTFVRYQISMEYDKLITEEAASSFQELLSRESLIITKRSKKAKGGQTQLDIIPLIHGLEDLSYDDNCLHLQILLHAQNPGLNPDLLIGAFRNEYPSLSPDFIRFHRKQLLDDELQSYE
jgi:radical SAM-linked protein